MYVHMQLVNLNHMYLNFHACRHVCTYVCNNTYVHILHIRIYVFISEVLLVLLCNVYVYTYINTVYALAGKANGYFLTVDLIRNRRLQ